MSESFVGTTLKPIDLKTLQDIIKRCVSKQGWHFLRWPHRVRLFEIGSEPTDVSAEDFATCSEGQAFNQTRELRWKRQGTTTKFSTF